MFATDPATGDLVRGQNGTERISGLEEIAQWVRTRSRLFRGECFLRTDLGVLYLGAGGILAKGTSQDDILGEFRSAAFETPGVVSVDEMDINQTDEQRAARQVSITYTATISLDNLNERAPLQDTFTVAAF